MPFIAIVVMPFIIQNNCYAFCNYTCYAIYYNIEHNLLLHYCLLSQDELHLYQCYAFYITNCSAIYDYKSLFTVMPFITILVMPFIIIYSILCLL